jgi:phosphate starvation-inducible protein PhoH and related proteins
LNILKDVDDIEIIKFSQKDVVRHRLVQDIIKAYEKYDEKQLKKKKEKISNE